LEDDGTQRLELPVYFWAGMPTPMSPKALCVHVVLERDDVGVVTTQAQGVGTAKEEALPFRSMGYSFSATRTVATARARGMGTAGLASSGGARISYQGIPCTKKFQCKYIQ
jgi:hypothetical protein